MEVQVNEEIKQRITELTNSIEKVIKLISRYPKDLALILCSEIKSYETCKIEFEREVQECLNVEKDEQLCKTVSAFRIFLEFLLAKSGVKIQHETKSLKVEFIATVELARKIFNNFYLAMRDVLKKLI